MNYLIEEFSKAATHSEGLKDNEKVYTYVDKEPK